MNPTLEIITDDCAAFVKEGHRFEISGPVAAEIIRAYRHLLTHEGTGETDAAHYLWGAIDGMRYSLLNDAARRLKEIEERIPPDFSGLGRH